MGGLTGGGTGFATTIGLLTAPGAAVGPGGGTGTTRFAAALLDAFTTLSGGLATGVAGGRGVRIASRICLASGNGGAEGVASALILISELLTAIIVAASAPVLFNYAS